MYARRVRIDKRSEDRGCGRAARGRGSVQLETVAEAETGRWEGVVFEPDGAVGGRRRDFGDAGFGVAEAWYVDFLVAAYLLLMDGCADGGGVDLLVIGTGLSIAPLSPATRRLINDMGIRVEALDTRNAAAQYNLLATERGVHEIAAALIPVGWKN